MPSPTPGSIDLRLEQRNSFHVTHLPSADKFLLSIWSDHAHTGIVASRSDITKITNALQAMLITPTEPRS